MNRFLRLLFIGTLLIPATYFGQEGIFKDAKIIEKSATAKIESLKDQETQLTREKNDLQKGKYDVQANYLNRRINQLAQQREVLQNNLKDFTAAKEEFDKPAATRPEKNRALDIGQEKSRELTKYTQQLAGLLYQPGEGFYRNNKQVKAFDDLVNVSFTKSKLSSQAAKNNRLLDLNNLATDMIRQAATRGQELLGKDFKKTADNVENSLKKITKRIEPTQQVKDATNAALYTFREQALKNDPSMISVYEIGSPEAKNSFQFELTNLNKEYQKVISVINTMNTALGSTTKLPQELTLQSLESFSKLRT